MVKRRRFDSWSEWNRLHTTVTVPLHPPLSQRALHATSQLLLRWLTAVAVLLLLLLALVQRATTRAAAPSTTTVENDLLSTAARVREHAIRLVVRDSLYKSLNCARLVSTLTDADARVRSAAMPAVIAALRADRCSHAVLRALDSENSGANRARLLQVVSAVGTPLSRLAHYPLLRALQHDSASDGAAASALARTGNREPQTLRALRVAFRQGHGIARGEALSALLALEPDCGNMALVREGLRDQEPIVRRMAVESLEPLVFARDQRCPNMRQMINAMTADNSSEVKAAALKLLSIADH